MLSHKNCYEAVKAQDHRFDGVFFTAVKTTKIYCRPICRVKAPKSENCTFYESAELAEAAGYRPCLRCRPELAPAYSEYKQKSEIVKQAISIFEDHQNGPGVIEVCANELGVSTRHLHRSFIDELGVSPIQYIMTRRLLLAKSLLTDTRLKIKDIALVSGFGSVSRFNVAFKKHYRLTPTTIRRSKETPSFHDGICIYLSYRPPYDHLKMLEFLKARCVQGVEMVADGFTYRRTYINQVQGQTYKGWLEVTFQPHTHQVCCKLSPSLLPILQHVIRQVKRVFDLDFNPNILPPGIAKNVRLPGAFNGFEMSTRAILGQQITVKAAHTIAGRLVEQLGTEIATPWPELNRLFPSPQVIVDLGDQVTEVLGPLGIIKNRSRAIFHLAQKLFEGDLDLSSSQDIDKTRDTLLSIKGIGKWTADYLTMRALSWPDIFLEGDVGVRHALMDTLVDHEGCPIYDMNRLKNQEISKGKMQKSFEKAAVDHAEKYHPWRSYYTISLWHSLS